MNAFFTDIAATLRHGMKTRDPDIDYLFLEYLLLLEALEGGVVPAEEQVDTLVRMRLVDRVEAGVSLTMEARVKLANLRSLLREHAMSME